MAFVRPPKKASRGFNGVTMSNRSIHLNTPGIRRWYAFSCRIHLPEMIWFRPLGFSPPFVYDMSNTWKEVGFVKLFFLPVEPC